MGEPQRRDHVVARAAVVGLVVDEELQGFEAAAQGGPAKPELVRGPDGRLEGDGWEPRAGGGSGRQGLLVCGPPDLPETEPREQHREAQGSDAETELGAPPRFPTHSPRSPQPTGARLAWGYTVLGFAKRFSDSMGIFRPLTTN
jgi:hypothetical protein